MVPATDTKTLLVEGIPAAVVLLLWGFVGVLVPHPAATTGARLAGLLMVVLYVGVRGVELARAGAATPHPTDVGGVLYENAWVALAAGSWFVGAALVAAVENAYDSAGLPGASASPADLLAFALAGTGVATVLLYGIAAGLLRVRGRTDPDASGTAQTAD